MKRVLAFLPKDPDGCAFYRGSGVLGELRRFNIDIKRVERGISWVDISESDIAFMQRPYTDNHVQIIDFLKGKLPIWVDYDDYLLEIPYSNPAFKDFSSPEVRKNLLYILEQADIISVSTKRLQDALVKSSLNPNLTKYKIIPNAYNDYRLSMKYDPSTTNKCKVVLWRGTNTHVNDLMIHKDAIQALINNNPDVRFVFLGFIPWMLDLTLPNIFIVMEQDLFGFFKSIDKISPDILIVPLEDNLLNRCKSNIAWMEVSRLGTMVVAPDFKTWEVPGVYTYSSDDLFQNIVQSAIDVGLRASFGWEYIQENLLLSNVNKRRIQLINDWT